MQKKFLFKTLLYLTIISIIWASKALYLEPLGKFLTYETALQPTPYTLILSGGHGNRVKKGALRFKENLTQNLIMLGGPSFNTSWAQIMKSYAIEEFKIPSNNILTEGKSTSTLTNATEALSLLKKLNQKKVLIVTSKFHTRRAYSIFNKVFKDSNIIIMITGAEDNINYKAWWNNSEMCEKILIEWGKTIWYWIFF